MDGVIETIAVAVSASPARDNGRGASIVLRTGTVGLRFRNAVPARLCQGQKGGVAGSRE